MPIVRVLKPFVFTFPQVEGNRGSPTEEKFVPGDISIPDDHPMLKHWWFVEYSCDGRVESPKQAVARLDAERIKRDEEEAANAVAKVAAEQAMARLTGARSESITASKAEIEAELNTPVNILRGKQAPLSIAKKA
jgi:hypothetical protein